MEFKLNFKKFHKEKEFKKEKMQINPDKYWNFVLAFIFVVIFGGFVFGFLLWNEVNSEIVIEEQFSNSQGINQKKLKEALEIFEKREKAREEIITIPSEIVDPSV